MATKTTRSKQKRVYYSELDNTAKLGNLIEHQLNSFDWFVQEGLGEIFEEINPIDD